MSDPGMLAHLARIVPTTPETPGMRDTTPPVTPPETPAPAPAPAPAPTPAPAPSPATPDGAAPAMSAPLRDWLIQQRSGHNVLTPEMYQYFGGDAILQQLQKFDPNAQWSLVDISGGEGGGQGQGLRLDFDYTKLPTVGGPGGGRGFYDTGLVPAWGGELRNSALVYNDPNYGPLTLPQNIKKQKDPGWVKWAPLVVAGAATLGAGLPALAATAGAAELGAGAAAEVGSAAAGAYGGTGAVTGGVAGLSAGNIAAQGAGSWWTSLLQKAPGLANQAGQMYPDPYGATPPPARPAASTPPPAPASALDTGQFNAAEFNNTGNQRSASSNQSSLTATQFSDDPYGFSNKGFR